jgi:hypothetical protein
MTVEVVKELPDFTITIDIDALVFVWKVDKKDFVVKYTNQVHHQTVVIVKIIKQSAFLISYRPY